MAYGALSAAAALLVVIAVSLLARVLTSPDRDGPPDVAGDPRRPASRSAPEGDARALKIARIGQSEIADGGRLFRELEGLFDHDLRYVTDTGSGVRLGVWPVSGGPIADVTPLLIRVIVVERKSTEASWRELMKVDLLTRSQELIEAVPDPKLDNRVCLWAHVLPDGKVAVDSSIQLAEPIHASVDVTNVLAPGEPAKILSLETEQGEYRIFQVVVPLPEQEGASC